MATIRASESGLQQVDKARLIKKWNKHETAWFELALTTKATIKRFWAKRPIDADAFESICNVVGIEDWESIADLPTLTLADDPVRFSAYNPQTFTGRDAEIAELTTLLSDSCRILAITGMTGIGKTALAERVVANLMETPESAKLPYIRFSLDDRLSPDFSISGAVLLRELGEEPTLADQQDAKNLLTHLLEKLCSHPCRLQIDSLERLLKGNEQDGWSEFCDPLWLDLLQQFLAKNDCPSQLLLTSQDIPGDLDTVASRYPQFWQCQTLQGLNSDEQRDFFQKLGLPANADSTATDLDYLNRIGAFYDGHPLVLQVIADEILQPPFQRNISSYWHHYAVEFTATTPTTNKLSRSRLFRRRVRHRVEQTLQRLPSPARQMLCASAVFRCPVPEKFWLAMLMDEDSQIAFDTLQDRHLVEFTPTSDNSFFVRQHNLIRSVAYDLLKADTPTWQQAERKAAQLWLMEYRPATDAPKLEIVRGYLEAFEHYVAVGDKQKAVEIAWVTTTETGNNLCWQLFIWGYYQESIFFNFKLCEIARDIGDQKSEGYALGNLGVVLTQIGQARQAIEYYEQQHNIVSGKYWRSEGASLGNRGLAYYRCGDYEKAIDFFQKQRIFARKVADPICESRALSGEGLAYHAQGKYQQALTKHQQHLEMAKIGDPYGKCHALDNLGKTLISLRQFPEAKNHLSDALIISRIYEFSSEEAEILKNLAELNLALGNSEEARQYCQQALALATELGIPLEAECRQLQEELEKVEDK